METIIDSQTAAQAAAGDPGAVRAIVEKCQAPVYGYLLRLCANPQDAQDAAQDTFLKALGSLQSFDLNRPFLPWLFSIAHNTAVDLLRKRKDWVSIDDAMPEPAGHEDSPHKLAEAAFRKEAVEKTLAAVPAAYREVLILRHTQNAEYSEIAEILAIPEGTVKIRLFRARKILRDKLASLNLAENL